MTRRHSNLAVLAAAILVLGACSTGDPGGNGNGNGNGNGLEPPVFELKKEAALTAFDACLDMEAYLADLAVAELLRGTAGGGTSGSGSNSGSTIGVDTASWGGGGADAGAPMPSWEDAGGAGTGGGAGSGGGGSTPSDRPADWTDTNTQTEGVDEADFVKTDGQYLYVVSGKTLRILAAWPPEETREIGALALDLAPFDMFLHGDTALLFTRLDRYDVPDDFAEVLRPDRDISQLTLLTVVDLADRAAPRVSRTLHVEGGYVSARMVDGTAFVVARSSVSLDRSTGWDVPPSWTSQGDRPDAGFIPGVADAGVWVDMDAGSPPSWDAGEDPGPIDTTEPPAEDTYGSDPWPSVDAGAAPSEDAGFGERRFALTADEAREAVQAIVSRRTADDWLPRYRSAVYGADGEETVSGGLIVACDDVYRPATPFGQDLLVVLSVDLADPTAAIGSQAVIGGAETVYASSDALYVAASKARYWYYDSLEADEREQTAIHKFSLEGGVAAYRASGDVPGRLLNQFSLDEFEANLRVATTTGWGWESPQESHVLVLGESDGRLAETGRLDGLGAGEDLYAVRFLGPRGFVVTFRQVDPLFTLDLSDPANPRQVGELEIPGFSTYLHPMDDDHLLAIGEARSGEVGGEWFEEEWGVKLAIFDVSDLANPREVRKTVIGGASSEAQYDHRAFTYYAAQGVLAVPVSSWGWDYEQPQQTLQVWDVSAEDGFALRGEVDHADLGAALLERVEETRAYCWGQPVPTIRRGLFLEDNLYTVSVAGVKVNPLADLEQTLATVPFDDLCALSDVCDIPECWGEARYDDYMP